MEKTKSNFKNKVSFKTRKLAISLKRNFYIVPLLIVLVTACQFLCELFILSPMYNRIYTDLTPWGSFNCIFVFLISLFCILYCVAYLNYAIKSYGSKRPVYMLIIYYVLWALNLLMIVLIFISDEKQIAQELANYNSATDQSSKDIYLEYYRMGLKTETALIWQLILSGISFVVVTIAPFIQKALKKISFKKINEDGQEEIN